MATYIDSAGDRWEDAGVNAFQQRLIRCVEGKRLGEVILNPHCGAPEIEDEKPARRLDSLFIESLYSLPFWERD